MGLLQLWGHIKLQRILADLSCVRIPIELRRNDGPTFHLAQAKIRHEKLRQSLLFLTEWQRMQHLGEFLEEQSVNNIRKTAHPSLKFCYDYFLHKFTVTKENQGILCLTLYSLQAYICFMYNTMHSTDHSKPFTTHARFTELNTLMHRQHCEVPTRSSGARQHSLSKAPRYISMLK